uniref:Uncharacterized protein n=1 Tax=Setaria italica TaxID=4555 RepID=K3ZKT5_SETIT
MGASNKASNEFMRNLCVGSQRLVAPDVPMQAKYRPSEHLMVSFFTSCWSNGSLSPWGYLYPHHSPIWSC